MARIRTVKPEFWKSESLSDLPEATHLLAAALINYADDEGYFNANPGLIKGDCCPLREPSVSIPESLRSLQGVGYLRLGTGADGKRYGHLVCFLDHQKISHPTASKISKISITWDNSGKTPEASENAQDNFRPEQGKEGNREHGSGKESLAAGEFDSFFAVFPKQEQRDNAEKEFAKALGDGATVADIVDGAKRFAAHVAREKTQMKFVQLAKTWLADGCWKDRYGAPDGQIVLPPLHPSWPPDVVKRWTKSLGEVVFRTYLGPAQYIDADPVRVCFSNWNRRRLAEENCPGVAKEVALEVAA